MLAQLGWSQEFLGQEIHSDPATVSRWLNGRVRPSKTTLARIAHATKIDFKWLLSGEGEMRPHDETEPSGQNIRELLRMTSRILSSASEYRQPLSDDIRMFYRAMNTEEEMRGSEQEVVALRAELAELKDMVRTLVEESSSPRKGRLSGRKQR